MSSETAISLTARATWSTVFRLPWLILRLAVAPVICYGLCLLFGVTGLARDVFLVESALPVVTQVTVLAGAYGADEKYAATGACLSIFGCCISLPVLMLLVS